MQSKDKPEGLFCQRSQIFAPAGSGSSFSSPAPVSAASPADTATASGSSSGGKALVSPSTATVLPALISADQLALVCDVKDVGEKVYRLNDQKLLAWLRAKVSVCAFVCRLRASHERFAFWSFRCVVCRPTGCAAQ
jgi:hypothetical protein